MANAAPSSVQTTSSTSKKEEAQNAITGGVWAQTSSKMDKLVELKSELREGQLTLDDAATEVQKLDLELADGLRLVCRAIDEGHTTAAVTNTTDDVPQLEQFVAWLESENIQSDTINTDNLDKLSFEAHMTNILRKVDGMILELKSPESLALLRDFMDPSELEEMKLKAEEKESQQQQQQPSSNNDTMATPVTSAFDSTLILYRALLLQSAAEALLSSWDVLTKVSDGDMDRAAVADEDPPVVTTTSRAKVHAVLHAYLHPTATCADATRAWWTLLDRDCDGRLDEVEMKSVAYKSMEPVQSALERLFAQAVEARQVTLPLPELLQDEDKDTTTTTSVQKMSWRQERREKKAKKILLKTFHKAVQNHFDLYAETPHRLRCIYAWAEKEHQNNKIDSVVVDTGAEDAIGVLAGKKRYVELNPKISYDEFVEEQRHHFKQLNHVGEQIITSFKEDLHVIQGMGRQSQELRRDMFLFFLAVSFVDLGIGFL